MYMGARFVAAAAGLAILAVGSASASIINIQGSIANSAEQTGANFTGTIDYTATGASAGVVTIVLNNVTPAAVGGYLTGFVFNIDSTDVNASATLTSTTNPNFLNTGPESANPFGSFDAGAALGANWEGGGNPALGIPVGGSGTFTFNVAANDAMSLTSSSFINGPNQFNFVVRFRGLTGGGSDKVPVPAPGPIALAALGLLCLAKRRTR